MSNELEFKPELIENMAGLAKEKGVDREVVLDSLKEALVMAARKYTQIPKRFDVNIDEETGEITVKLRVEVVDDFPDYPEEATAEEVAALDEKYMLIDEAREYDAGAQVGDLLEMPIPVEAFGRSAVQAAKQIMVQKVRDVEKRRILAAYQGRIGSLVTGTVQQVDRKFITVLIGGTEAEMPAKEQIRKEQAKVGDSIRAVIADVADTAKGAKVILSRANGQFLIELFKQEVPEIGDGIVEIKGVARDPGFRSKISVISRDDRIDPVGACVGMRGTRVQNIVREISNERIDIVQWTDDMALYIRRALSPADIRKMVEVKGTNRIILVINDEDLSQAIGRNGQNVRLASQLVGRNLEIIGESDYMAYSEEERHQMAQPRKDDQILEAAPQRGREDLDALFGEPKEETEEQSDAL